MTWVLNPSADKATVEAGKQALFEVNSILANLELCLRIPQDDMRKSMTELVNREGAMPIGEMRIALSRFWQEAFKREDVPCQN